MVIFRKSKFLNVAMLCSTSMGIFPSRFLFEENKFGQLCYSIYSKVTFGYFIIFVLTSYIELILIIFHEDINIAELSRNLIITPLFTITIIRQVLIMSPSFKKLLNYILDNERYMDMIDDKKVIEIDKKCASDFNRNIKIYLGMMIITELSYTLRPLFEPEQRILLNNSTVLVKQLPLSTWFPFDREKNFMAAYLIHVVDIIFGSCYDTYGEFILIAVIVYPTGQLKVLQHVLINFESYQYRLKENYGIQNDNLAAFIALRKCIDLHQSIIRYVEEFNNIMGTCMFLDFIQSSLHMACVLSETLTEQVTLMQLIPVAAYLIILNFRLFLYYYYANEIIILSQGLSVAIYQSNWYKQSKHFKYMVFMMIMRNQKPIKIKLGAFGDMSLNKFISILNAAYSYVMLMCSVN
uniref:Odorant receptor n=1 Tax=Eucryptorrhynchus scrobiculatus TaxID=1552824 RepID=A0A8F4RTA3_EUCSC|nr:odorant receptor 16 [Eucryptorrhynchus scrobiculatus]